MFQHALGTHDLGKFYHKPIRDSNGSIVLSTVNFIQDPKVVTFGSGKWIPLSRLHRRQSAPIGELFDMQDCLVSSISVSLFFFLYDFDF